MRTVNPDTTVHPLRLELDDDQIRDIFVRIDANDDTVTLEELEAAQDWLYDYIAGSTQTVYGTTVVQ